MIVVSHNYIKVVTVEIDGDLASFDSKLTIAALLYEFAKKYPDQIIIWCHEKVKEVLHLDYIATSFPHNRLLLSYNPFGNFFPYAIGYVEDSPFINVNKEVRYPTWQMSSYVGAIKAKTILLTDSKLWDANHFDCILNSIAKKYQSKGLFCYSDPDLVTATILINVPKANFKQVFAFVNQHYKKTWVYLLLLNLFLYEKKFPVFAFFATFFQSKGTVAMKEINFESAPSAIELSEETIDVIIPTIGRKQYLYDVLCDLKAQTHLPQNVIIVEQNPLPDSVSELDYITSEQWPFAIKHIFTHQTGACQARNKALAEVKSKWVFLNDDDNRFYAGLLEESIATLIALNINCLQTAYPQLNESIATNIISQASIFGSGNTILKSELVAKIKFNLALEFGYGEDTEFGLQLRNSGVDVVYVPTLEIKHLKAPIGGFRTKFVHPWEAEKIQPKPSPTVLFYRLKYYTKEQLQGYRTVLFIKFYKVQMIKNPFQYLKAMNEKWHLSLTWATILLQKNEV